MKVKIFYGWYIVGAGILISALGGITGYGFTALVGPIISTCGWSYAQISLAMSLRGAQAGVLAPFVGRAVDRWPIKRLILAGVIIIGLGYILLSRVTTLPMFYASFMVIALGTSLSTHMVPGVAVVRWFRRNVGKATGLLALGIGLGGLSTPILVKLIDALGWRNTLLILAATVWMIGIPLSFVFRNRPQDYGMFPDGKPPDKVKETGRVQAQEFSLGVKQTLKTRAFWQFGIADTLRLSAVGAVMLHVMPYLDSLGIDRPSAAMVAMTFPLISLPSRFSFGWMADIFKKRYVCAVSSTLMAIGLLLFSFTSADKFGLAFGFAAAYGIGIGGIVALRAPLVREYFGTKNFGTIFGMTSIFTTIGMMLSPPLVGLFYDIRGTYFPIWLILSGCTIVAAILFSTMPSPSTPSPRSPVP